MSSDLCLDFYEVFDMVGNTVVTNPVRAVWAPVLAAAVPLMTGAAFFYLPWRRLVMSRNITVTAASPQDSSEEVREIISSRLERYLLHSLF